MFQKVLVKFAFLFVVLTAYTAQSQIVTSKKAALKKGIYQKPSEDLKADATTDKTVVVAKNGKSAAKANKAAKAKKLVITDNGDTDLLPLPNDNYLALQMINNAMSFIGVRYHGGGTTKAGMDCSGMITAVFDIFDMKLPRSSIDMSKVGTKLANDEIKKGDLIFFKTNGRNIINHVGMVIDVIGDEIKFVHSSTSKGVIVSSTKEAYYSKTFAQANRIL